MYLLFYLTLQTAVFTVVVAPLLAAGENAAVRLLWY